MKEILKKHPYPTEHSVFPQNSLQNKIDFFFKPYNGDQELCNWMKFTDDSNAEHLTFLRSKLATRELSPDSREAIEIEIKMLNQAWTSLGYLVIEMDPERRA